MAGKIFQILEGGGEESVSEEAANQVSQNLLQCILEIE